MTESTLTQNRWTITRKAGVVLELLRGGDAVELARRYGLSQAQLFAWRDRFLEDGQTRSRPAEDRSPLSRSVRRNPAFSKAAFGFLKGNSKHGVIIDPHGHTSPHVLHNLSIARYRHVHTLRLSPFNCRP